MFLAQLRASCGRRKVLLCVLVGLTLALSVVAWRVIETDFEAEASVVLVPPRSSEDPELNRFLSLGSVGYSVDVLAKAMKSDETTRSLMEQVPGAGYDVAQDLTTSAPIVTVTATSADAASAMAMLNAVMTQLPITLIDLQVEVDIPESNWITPIVVAADDAPTENVKTRVRLVGALAIVLLVASLLIVAAVDGVLLRRAMERDSEQPDRLAPRPEMGNALRPDEFEPVAAKSGEPDEAGRRPRRGLTRRSSPPHAGVGSEPETGGAEPDERSDSGRIVQQR